MSSSFIYGLVLFYPFISIVILRLSGDGGAGLLSQIINEYKLWFWTSVAYFGMIILLFFGTRIVMPGLLDFILYTIFYFLISVVRKFLITESKDIFAKDKPAQ